MRGALFTFKAILVRTWKLDIFNCYWF